MTSRLASPRGSYPARAITYSYGPLPRPVKRSQLCAFASRETARCAASSRLLRRRSIAGPYACLASSPTCGRSWAPVTSSSSPPSRASARGSGSPPSKRWPPSGPSWRRVWRRYLRLSATVKPGCSWRRRIRAHSRGLWHDSEPTRACGECSVARPGAVRPRTSISTGWSVPRSGSTAKRWSPDDRGGGAPPLVRGARPARVECVPAADRRTFTPDEEPGGCADEAGNPCGRRDLGEATLDLVGRRDPRGSPHVRRERHQMAERLRLPADRSSARCDAPPPRHMQTATGTLGLATGLAAKRRGIPSLVKYTADMADERLNRHRPGDDGPAARSAVLAKARLFDAWQRALFSIYDGVWATTPAFADAARDRFGVPEEKICVLRNFVDLAQ